MYFEDDRFDGEVIRVAYNILLEIDTKTDVPLWRRLYEALAKALADGKVEAGSRLPSIRSLSNELGVSRSPVENAYLQLQIDGLIESKPKSGYFAAEAQGGRARSVLPERANAQDTRAMYDLRPGRVDAQTADITEWRRCLRFVLNEQDDIVSVGDPQGELRLREALVGYCYKARGVSASPDTIFIASGTQQLLALLCRIIGRGKRAVMEMPGFVQAERIFSDSGWEVQLIDKDRGDGIADELKKREADMFVDITSNRPQISLSRLFRRRKRITEWARQNDKYLLEDDYNGELRYISRQIPSLQGLAPERVVYIGSFSGILLPSVRIAYMALPARLSEAARESSLLYDQTSSKIEQLALAEYIKRRRLERHIKRIRKFYQAKSRALLSALSEAFPGCADFSLLETSLAILVSLRTDASAKDLALAAAKHGALVEPLRSEKCMPPTVLLSFSGIPAGHIEAAVGCLKTAWRGFVAAPPFART